MNIGNDKSDNLTQQQTFLVFIITAAALFAVGNFALLLGPTLIGPVALGPEALAQFTIPSNVSPKPLERFVFLSVTLSVMPVLFLAAYAARRFSAQIMATPSPGTAQAFNSPNGINRRSQWPVMALVMAFALYSGGYFRWFGASEVDYKFIDPVSLDAVIFSIVRIAQGGDMPG
jgi:hypothetical protein